MTFFPFPYLFPRFPLDLIDHTTIRGFPLKSGAVLSFFFLFDFKMEMVVSYWPSLRYTNPPHLFSLLLLRKIIVSLPHFPPAYQFVFRSLFLPPFVLRASGTHGEEDFPRSSPLLSFRRAPTVPSFYFGPVVVTFFGKTSLNRKSPPFPFLPRVVPDCTCSWGRSQLTWIWPSTHPFRVFSMSEFLGL